MSGMNRSTGRCIDDTGEHIRQSIRDILTTPVGSRIKRRAYGSLLPALIDQPGNPANRLRLMSATVIAIINWEPRIAVQRASLEQSIDGSVTVALDAVRRDGARSGDAINLSIPLR